MYGKRKMFHLLVGIVVIIPSMAEVGFAGVFSEFQKFGKENYISVWCNWITQQSPKLSNFRSSRNAGAIYRYDGRVSLSPFLPALADGIVVCHEIWVCNSKEEYMPFKHTTTDRYRPDPP